MIEGIKVNLDGVEVPTDFVVIESPPRVLGAKERDTMLLGRPFIKATRMVIDLHFRNCTYDVQGKQQKLLAYSNPKLSVAQDMSKKYIGAFIGPLYIYSHL